MILDLTKSCRLSTEIIPAVPMFPQATRVVVPLTLRIITPINQPNLPKLFRITAGVLQIHRFLVSCLQLIHDFGDVVDLVSHHFLWTLLTEPQCTWSFSLRS